MRKKFDKTRRSAGRTPVEIYHGVPKKWSKEEILSTYNSLKGQYPLDIREVPFYGAPHWMPDRYNWLQYRHMLYEIAKGMRMGDHACIELAIRYIELNYFGSYSGFIRAKFARHLTSQEVSEQQKKRLCNHFRWLIDNNECFEEFSDYNKLRRKWGC